MDTVFRPGLRQCFQFHISRVASLLMKILYNSLQFFITKAELLPDLLNFYLFQFESILRIFNRL
ncbi:hypothetical protein ES708_17561 [subsurface metagenome]